MTDVNTQYLVLVVEMKSLVALFVKTSSYNSSSLFLSSFQLPEFWPGQSVSNPSEEAVWVDVSRSSPSQGEEEEQDERARLVQTTQHLLREAREKSRGWESCSGPDNVDLAFKKVCGGI